jgi:hypothetical protein
MGETPDEDDCRQDQGADLNAFADLVKGANQHGEVSQAIALAFGTRG